MVMFSKTKENLTLTAKKINYNIYKIKKLIISNEKTRIESVF